MLIKGINLTRRQKNQVLQAFIYRWTFENAQADKLYSQVKSPTIPKVKDANWIKAHAFHFLKDGSRLMLSRRNAEPAYLAE